MTPPRRVTLIPGDGIGPDVVAAARRVLEATGVVIEWEVHDVGAPAFERGGDPLPEEVLDSVRRNGVALKGPVSGAGMPFPSVNIALRRELDLYVQIRPSRRAPLDVVVIRETTEDLYAGVELPRGEPETVELIDRLRAAGHSELRRDAALSLKPQSEAAARRALEFAFDWARRTGRRKVTAVHKAAVMKATDGLFLETAREVARAHADLEFDDGAVDTVAARLVRRPEECDVLVTTNLYGDVLSDLASALCGGVGLGPGANYGDGIALFEPVHGSAPRLAGLGRASPVGAILSGGLLLRHLGEAEAAARVEAAVEAVVGADLGTAAFADAVVAALLNSSPRSP